MADEKKDDTGCLILVLLAFPIIDAIGMLMASAGPCIPVVQVIGLGGFAAGATLGAFVSVTIKKKPWYSSCRWAIYGLLGATLAMAIAVWIILRFQPH